MILALDFDGVLHPRVTQAEPIFCRAPLLEAWCASAGHRSWLALDDDPRLFEPGCQQLCLVDHRQGLKPGTLFRLKRMLENVSPGG